MKKFRITYFNMGILKTEVIKVPDWPDALNYIFPNGCGSWTFLEIKLLPSVD